MGRAAGRACALAAVLAAPGCGWLEVAWLDGGRGFEERRLVLARPVGAGPAAGGARVAEAAGFAVPGPGRALAPGGGFAERAAPEVRGRGGSFRSIGGARTILVAGERSAAPGPPVWRVRAGETLRATLRRWGENSGVAVFWEACDERGRCVDWLNQGGGAVEGDFETALSWLLRGHGEAEPRPVAVVAHNGSVRILADGALEAAR